jgi:hypothetical protein
MSKISLCYSTSHKKLMASMKMNKNKNKIKIPPKEMAAETKQEGK